MAAAAEFEGIDLFERTFRHQIKEGGKIEDLKYLFTKKFGDGEDEWPVEAHRYRLIWMPGCPHATKAVITWNLLGLNDAISLATTGILRSENGWVFSEDPGGVDPVLGVSCLHEIYLRSYPDYTGRSTVPTIADTKTGLAVNNDHINIPKYFCTAWEKFHRPDAPDLYPAELADDIDALNEWILARINNGVYESGFARSQQLYEEGYTRFFEAMDIMDERLKDRRFLFGDFITLSDIFLFVTLSRFQVNYYQLFRANKKRLEDYENLWPYARDLYAVDEIAQYTWFDKIKQHYQLSPHLRALFGNVEGIYAKGPDISGWKKPSQREHLSGSESRFKSKG